MQNAASCLVLALLLLILAPVLAQGNDNHDHVNRPSILLITVDDMNRDSIGAYGCAIPGITPHIDRLASQGMRFDHAHVTIAICQPTRAVWMTGRYPHRSGALGFDKINKEVPTLLETMAKAGYYTGIMAKVPHVIPSRTKAWNVVVPASKLGFGRDPQKYYQHAKRFFANAAADNAPFFLMANAQDPHRPFAGSAQEKKRSKTRNYPDVSPPLQPGDIPVPGFLPDLPDIRTELAEYYNSVRRADEVTGAVLKALAESGLADNTLVLFTSDHGMPLPFAKTNCWRHSTITPWIIRWPGTVEPNTIDAEHVISGIDLTPTILEITGATPLPGVDGRSFLALLKGEKQSDREKAFTSINRTHARNNYPMRCVMTKDASYIFNGWADGKTTFKNESQSGLTMKAMEKAAADDEAIAARVQFYLHRTPEELYHYSSDPDALHNLADDPAHENELEKMRDTLLQHLKDTEDPVLPAFQKFLEESRNG